MLRVRSLRSRAASLLALALLPVAGASAATVGPIEDFRAPVDNPGPSNITIIINTKFWKLTDRIEINLPPIHLRMAGVAYVTPQSTGGPDLVSINTIYGIDANPAAAGLTLTGFNPLTPEVIPMSPEIFTDEDNNEYLGSVAQPLPISALANFMPAGADLSPFAGADPNSLVYLFTTTNVPAAAVPEPATLGLAAGAALLGAIRRRRVTGRP